MVPTQRSQRQTKRAKGIDPNDLLDLGRRGDRTTKWSLESIGLHHQAILIRRFGAEFSEIQGSITVYLETKFFPQFARQGCKRGFVRFDLAAGLHEELRAALAHHKYMSGVIEDDGRGDTDNIAAL